MEWAWWQPFLAWVALVPLFWVIRQATGMYQGWWMGWEFGTLSWMGILYWIVGMEELGPLAIPAWLGLSVALGLYQAVFGLGMVFLNRQSSSTHFQWGLVPAAWVALEFARSHLFTGFPWTLLGSSQWFNLPLIQWASVFGVYGISAVIVLGNMVVSAVLEKNKRYLVPFLLIVVLHGVGWWMFKTNLQPSVFSLPSVRVALLQGNIPQPEKWSREAQEKTYETYRILAEQSGKVDLMVWPETAAPNFIRYDSGARKRLEHIVQSSGSSHLIGAPDATLNEKGEIVQQANSVFLVSPDGTLARQYDKSHLVPFGEFTPFGWLKPLVTKYTIGVAEFRRGSGSMVMETPNMKFSPSICYEAIFPHEVRTSVLQGAEVLINVTNDAWFGRSAAPYQHAQAAAFRAVETGRYLVRAANTGVSYVIDPVGRIVGETALFERTVLKAFVYPRMHLTPYTRWGDWWMVGCAALFGLFHLVGRILAYRS